MTPNLKKLADSLQWMPAKGAPKDGNVILGRNAKDPYDKYGTTVSWYDGTYESHWTHEGDTDPIEITHWMPLPEGNASEIIRVLADALEKYARPKTIVPYSVAKNALARAERLAGGE